MMRISESLMKLSKARMSFRIGETCPATFRITMVSSTMDSIILVLVERSEIITVRLYLKKGFWNCSGIRASDFHC